VNRKGSHFTSLSLHMDRKEVQWLLNVGDSVVGLGEEEVKPGFTQSVSVFMVKVMELLFRWLPWWCRDCRSGYWLWVLSKSMLCFVSVECLATADCWFSSLVLLICSEIMVGTGWPDWLMHLLPHKQGIL
jgi:hypothetical protein